MNIVEKWVEVNKKKGITQTEAVKRLSMCCGENLRSSEISSIKKGKRRLTPCINNMMMNDTLHATLEEFGVEFIPIPVSKWVELIEQLSPPRRVK